MRRRCCRCGATSAARPGSARHLHRRRADDVARESRAARLRCGGRISAARPSERAAQRAHRVHQSAVHRVGVQLPHLRRAAADRAATRLQAVPRIAAGMGQHRAAAGCRIGVHRQLARAVRVLARARARADPPAASRRRATAFHQRVERVGRRLPPRAGSALRARLSRSDPQCARCAPRRRAAASAVGGVSLRSATESDAAPDYAHRPFAACRGRVERRAACLGRNAGVQPRALRACGARLGRRANRSPSSRSSPSTTDRRTATGALLDRFAADCTTHAVTVVHQANRVRTRRSTAASPARAANSSRSSTPTTGMRRRAWRRCSTRCATRMRTSPSRTRDSSTTTASRSRTTTHTSTGCGKGSRGRAASGDPLPALLRINVAISTGNFVFRRSLLEKTGGMCAFRVCHDWDFILGASYYTPLAFVGEPLYEYRVHRANTYSGLRLRRAPRGRSGARSVLRGDRSASGTARARIAQWFLDEVRRRGLTNFLPTRCATGPGIRGSKGMAGADETRCRQSYACGCVRRRAGTNAVRGCRRSEPPWQTPISTTVRGLFRYRAGEVVDLESMLPLVDHPPRVTIEIALQIVHGRGNNQRRYQPVTESPPRDRRAASARRAAASRGPSATSP